MLTCFQIYLIVRVCVAYLVLHLKSANAAGKRGFCKGNCELKHYVLHSRYGGAKQKNKTSQAENSKVSHKGDQS